MHWFWRAAIAWCLAWAVAFWWTTGRSQADASRLTNSLYSLIVADPPSGYGWSAGNKALLWNVLGSCIYHSPPVLAALLAYGALTKRHRSSAAQKETRCRKCGYILRGITEPRCPE